MKHVQTFLYVCLLAVAAQPIHIARSEEAAPEDGGLTRKLADMVRKSETLVDSGKPDEALKTLAEARELAAQAKRPEAQQMEARIDRIHAAMSAPKAEAPPSDDPKVAPEKLAPPKPKGVLLTLDECIEIAIQSNLALRLSRLDDRGSDISLKSAYSKYLPTFSGSFSNSNSESYSQTRNSLNRTTANNVSHSNASSFSSKVTQNSPWGGSVSLSGSASESHPLSGSARSGSVGVDVTQPLWKGFGTDVGLHGIRTSKINRLISRGNLELDVQQLIFDVKSAYANCIRQLQARQVNLKAVDSATRFLELTKARERAGQVTKLDVFNAEVQLADRELALTANERALENAFDQLKQIMDVDLEEWVAVIEEPVDFGEKPGQAEDKRIEIDELSGTVLLVTREVTRKEEVMADGTRRMVNVVGKALGKPLVMFMATRYNDEKILSEALNNRIELLNGRRNMAVQKLNSLLAKDGLGHQIDLNVGYSRSNTAQKWTDALDLTDSALTAGVSYSIPWGKVSDRSAYERALLDLQRSEIELKRVRTQVHRDVRDILRTLRETEKSTLIQGKKVEQAKRSVEAAQISFERGLKDSFDVIRAEDNLLQAKTDFINRRLDYVVRMANLEQVVGKPTGRVDLEAKLPGGMIDSVLPETLKDKPQPRQAPTLEPTAEDDPFEYRKKEKAAEERTNILPAPVEPAKEPAK